MITPFATSPRITENRSYVFRACVSDRDIARRLAKLALKRSAKKVTIVYDGGTLYSSTLYREFKDKFEREGGKIVLEEGILDNSLFYTKVAKKVVDTKPDLLFLPFYEETVMRFLVKAVEIEGFKDIKLLGSDGWATGYFFKEEKSRVSEMMGTWISHHNINPSTELEKLFVKEYTKKYGIRPRTSASYLGYDSVMFAYESINKGKGSSTLEKIKTYSKYIGVTGPIRFNEFNEPEKPLHLIEYDKKKILGKGFLE